MANPINHSLGSVELARGNKVPTAITDLLRANPNAEAFWSTSYRDAPDELRWDQSFPYQLMILEDTKQGYVQLPGGNSTFTLPIPPQSMTKSMPFAIGLTVTQGGIVEEHNGIPIRNITLQGTTGVLPGRTGGVALSKPNFFESVFAGTIRSAQSVANTAPKISRLNPDDGFRVNYIKDDEVLGDLKGTTGYLQFLLLGQFLEAYAHVKKTKAGRKYRLAFCHWKTGEVYLVTPINLDVTQNVSSPLEYSFNFSMKAWKRIDLARSGNAVQPNPSPLRSPGALQQLLTNLTAARNSIERLKDVISSAGQDVFNLCIEPLRQVGLFAKDALGVALVAADLPSNIVQSMKGAIVEVTALGDLTSALAGAPDELLRSLAELGSISSKDEVAAGFHGAVPAEGGTIKPQPPGPADLGAPHPMNKILENPADNYDFFSKLSPGRLNLRPATVAAMVKERERVRSLQRIDFEQMRDNLASLQADFCDAVGLGDATYNRVMGRAAPTSVRSPTDADYDVMNTLNAAIVEMNKLAVSGDVGDRNRIDVIDYIAGLAGRSGINFTIPASKFQVPFPYKNTLEQLATRYLGDPDRWMEIATLNRLRPPYVDEEGFDLSLLVNGNGNQILVSTAENLFVGQQLWLQSNNQNKDRRRITAIDPVSTGVVRVVVDGNPDLAKFTVSAQSFLHAFLPDTVNSMMLISIPSSNPAVEEDFRGKSIPGIDRFKNLLQVGGITLGLTGTGDAAITPDGGWRYAVGMDALVQRVRIWSSTVQGTLKRHPAFGIPIEVGASTADVSASDLLASLQSLSKFDPAFTGVEDASVVKNGPSAQIHATFKIAGTNQLLPITIEVER